MTIKELEQLEAIEYNHEAGTLIESLGITEERTDKVKELVLGVLGSEDRKSRVIEIILNTDDLTASEKVFALTKLGQLWTMADLGRMSGLLGSLGEE